MENKLKIRAAKAYCEITRPWIDKGLESPDVTIKELSRVARIDQSVLAKAIENSKVTFGLNGEIDSRLALTTPDGAAVDDINQSARKVAPRKKSEKEARYQSRAPGGGPVVKSGLKQRDLERKLVELGKGKLKVAIEPYDQEKERTERRRKKKEKLARRRSGQERKNIYVSNSRKRESERRTRSFMNFVYSNSVAPPQRPGRIKELMYEASVGSGNPVIINWICPPGTPLQFDPQTQKLYRTYSSIDPREGFRRDYRLNPRIDLEQRLVEQIKQIGKNATYIKIVADNNPFCLYPACIRKEGEKKSLEAIQNYTDYVQSRLDQETGENSILVATWTSLLGEDLFREFMERYKNTKFENLVPFLPPNTLDTEIDVLTKHTTPDPSLLPAFEQFAKDVIVQYAVEMDTLFDAFGDNVIVAWNESTRRGAMIDALRKSKGRPPLPKMYVLHRKRGEEIVNNF